MQENKDHLDFNVFAKNYEYSGALTLSIRMRDTIIDHKDNYLSKNDVLDMLSALINIMDKEHHRKLSDVLFNKNMTFEYLACQLQIGTSQKEDL